jgi:glycosyltransferase involved in cell wall biosynthesis
MSNRPVVSVVIPTYNHAHFLREALQSLSEQTYTAWEAIVVNNYSEDDTIAVVESFADLRIRLENFRNHGVIAASRNRGIALAQGAYIAFLDSDDTWYPEKLAKCMAHFGEGIGLVCHGLHWIGEQERDVYCGPEHLATFSSLLYEGCSITTSAAVVEKRVAELAGGFSEATAVVTAEDYHFWMKVARLGIKMHFIKEVLGEYRIHSQNQSGSVKRHLSAVLCVIEDFLPKEESRSFMVNNRIRRRYCLAYYGAGRAMQRQGQFGQSWPLFFTALAYWPFYLKCYAALILGMVGTAR